MATLFNRNKIRNLVFVIIGAESRFLQCPHSSSLRLVRSIQSSLSKFVNVFGLCATFFLFWSVKTTAGAWLAPLTSSSCEACSSLMTIASTYFGTEHMVSVIR